MKTKFERTLACIQEVYNKEKKRCIFNKRRLAEGHKNKKLKVELRDKQIESWKYKIRQAQEKYGMQKVFKVKVDQNMFQIEYDAAYYEKLCKYDGKYVI